MKRRMMHSRWSSPRSAMQRTSSSPVSLLMICCSGPGVPAAPAMAVPDVTGSDTSSVTTSRRNRLDLTWSRTRLRADLGVGRRGDGWPRRHGVGHLVGDDLQAEPARLDVVEHQVAGDRGEPRADVPALVTDRGDPPQRPEERLTGDVLREVAVTHSEE